MGGERAQVEPWRDDVRLGNPADRVVGADDLRVGALAVGELVRRLPADVRAQEVEDALAAGRAEDRELERLGDEGEPEVEMEDVRAGEEPCEGAPLGELAVREPAVAVE